MLLLRSISTGNCLIVHVHRFTGLALEFPVRIFINSSTSHHYNSWNALLSRSIVVLIYSHITFLTSGFIEELVFSISKPYCQNRRIYNKHPCLGVGWGDSVMLIFSILLLLYIRYKYYC